MDGWGEWMAGGRAGMEGGAGGVWMDGRMDWVKGLGWVAAGGRDGNDRRARTVGGWRNAGKMARERMGDRRAL